MNVMFAVLSVVWCSGMRAMHNEGDKNVNLYATLYANKEAIVRQLLINTALNSESNQPDRDSIDTLWAHVDRILAATIVLTNDESVSNAHKIQYNLNTIKCLLPSMRGLSQCQQKAYEPTPIARSQIEYNDMLGDILKRLTMMSAEVRNDYYHQSNITNSLLSQIKDAQNEQSYEIQRLAEKIDDTNHCTCCYCQQKQKGSSCQ